MRWLSATPKSSRWYDVIRAQRPTPVGSPESWYFGTGNSAIDTPAMNAAVASIQGAGRPLMLFGQIAAEWGDEPDFYTSNRTSIPNYTAIKITGSVHLRGPATFVMTPPASVPAAPIKPRYNVFGTPHVLRSGNIPKIVFEDITFDGMEEIGAPLPDRTQCMFFSSVTSVEMRNILCTTTPQVAEVTITADGSGNAVVTHSSDHPIEDGERGVAWFRDGTLPPEVVEGSEWMVRRLSSTTYNISAVDNGALLTITPGTYATTAYCLRPNQRGAYLVNVDKYKASDMTFEYGRQAYYSHYVRSWQESTVRFHRLAEGFDWDAYIKNINLTNVTATDFFGEAQLYDGANIQDAIITNTLAKGLRGGAYVYAKAKISADYEFFFNFHNEFDNAQFDVGAPGTVTVPEATNLYDGMRFWLDTREGDTPTPATTPTGTIAIYTPFYIRNPVGNVCNISETAAGALLEITGASVGNLVLRLVPEPADVVPASNVLIQDLIFADPIEEAAPDSDETYDDPELEGVGKKIAFVGHERNTRYGIDRTAQFRDVPRLTSNITFRNWKTSGGNTIRSGECEGLTLDGITMVATRPGTDSTDAAIILSQGNASAGDIAAGRVSATLRNIEILDCLGQPFYAGLPTRLNIDGFRVNGFNLQANDNTIRAMRLTNVGNTKPAHITLANLNISGGVNGATAVCRELSMTKAASNLVASVVEFSGAFNLASTAVGALHIFCDMGEYVASQRVHSIIIDTTVATGTATVRIPLRHSQISEAQALYAGIVNLDAVAGDAVNYTRLQIVKKDQAGTVSNITPTLNYDNAARVAVTATDMAVGGTGAPDTIIAATEMAYLEATRQGNGSRVVAELNFVAPQYTKVVA